MDLTRPARKRSREWSPAERDSADPISFGQLARLAASHAPPPMPIASAPADVVLPPPPPLPRERPASGPRRQSVPLPVRILAGVGAVAVGVALSAALGVETPASAAPAAPVPITAPDPAPMDPGDVVAAALSAPATAAPDPVSTVDEEREASRERDRRRAERRRERGEETPLGGEASDTAPAVPPEPAVPPPADLRDTPSREEVAAALSAVQPAVVACAAGEGGAVRVQVSVAPSGRVRTALVSGDFVGTPVGSCIARAVRTARMPPFASESFSVTYPYALPYAR